MDFALYFARPRCTEKLFPTFDRVKRYIKRYLGEVDRYRIVKRGDHLVCQIYILPTSGDMFIATLIFSEEHKDEVLFCV